MTLRTSLVVLLAVAGICRVANAQKASVTVHVTDEDGQAISNALVSAGFATMIKPGWGWGSGRPNTVKGYTDTNGMCSLIGDGNGGEVGIAVMKAGYYGSGGFNIIFTNTTGIVLKKWQPWNPTIEVVLKRIGQPVPMYARRVCCLKIPVIGEAVGFDLIRSDWVAPYGRGEICDFLFTWVAKPERTVTTRYGEQRLFDLNLSVSFSNEGDGIIPLPPIRRHEGSALRLDRQVPLTGYQSNVVKRIYNAENQPPQSNISGDQNYFFRVRTKRDGEGKVASALYGKIYGDFQFDAGWRITFTYYVNPTPNDRNVEFDPRQNLFKDLSPEEEVTDP